MMTDPLQKPTTFACYVYDPESQTVQPVEEAVWESATGPIAKPGGAPRSPGFSDAEKAAATTGEVIDTVQSYDDRFVAALTVKHAESNGPGWVPQDLRVSLPYECQLYRLPDSTPHGLRVRLPIDEARGRLVGGWTPDGKYLIYRSLFYHDTVCICPSSELTGVK